ncbi:MAG: FIST C-terminal domain-containing protein [Actinomycetota bacterium]|nr:FIST C-terminal domain-containing protein [Actinomycetota bacterium]
MGTVAGVGHSIRRNPSEAGREAALLALERAGVDKADFLFVFATVGYNQQTLIDSIRKATSETPLSGCSGEGIITQEAVVETGFGVSVMAISTSELRFHNASVRGIGRDCGIAGQQLALDIRKFAAPDSIACFVFADGLSFNFDPFVSAFEKNIHGGRWLPLFGGLAADNWTLQKTFQYHNGDVFSDGISCALMSGKGDVAWGVNHGCMPVGSELKITRCKGNVIYEVDGTPALDVLRDYLDEGWEKDWNKTSLNLCLGLRAPEGLRKDYSEHIIRYMMKKADREGSVTIQSDVCEGDSIWIMRRDKELITEGLKATAGSINEKTRTKRPDFVLQFDCVGRGRVVFREQEKIEMIRAMQRKIGQDIPWAGFYTYGEIGPVKKKNVFHNFTAVVLAVS